MTVRRTTTSRSDRARHRLTATVVTMVIATSLAAMGSGTVAAASLGTSPATAPAPTAPPGPAPVEARQRDYRDFIVKFGSGTAMRRSATARGDLLRSVGRTQGLRFREVRTLATGATLVRADRFLGAAGQRELVGAFQARRSVAYAVPDELAFPTAEPSDPQYASLQWHYQDGDGLRLPHAWNFSRGSGVDVAVLDTGRTTHPDLDPGTVGGWDFISDPTRARDGNGRDANPADQGDWHGAGECSKPDAENSSWHGTHVAGTVGARWNSQGGAGVAPSVRIQHVRVLGRCGGTSSDISDAIVWASGGGVAGAGTNGFPADVINMSLGGSSIFECNNSYQDAINSAVGRGTTVVVAAGNDNTSTENGTLAACGNVVVVGASDADSRRASFSNHGVEVDVSAPGTAVWSTLNTGTSTPGDPTYASYQGTSMATPHIAGLVALMLQKYPGRSPAQVESALKNATRPLADGCSDCGTGIADATELFLDLAGPVSTNSSLGSMFNTYADGSGYAAMCDDWTGGDGTQSIALPSGKRAWFFSDSYLGDYRLRTGAFYTSGLRNAMLVQSGSSLRTITGGNTCQEQRTDIDFLARYARTPVRESGNGFYWNADGMVVGSTVVKFWWRNVPTPDGFWQETNTAVTVQPVSDFDGSVASPTPRLMGAVTPYANHPILWGLSLMQDGATVYVYGAASMDASKKRRLFVARTTPANLADFSAWQFRTSTGGWSGAQSDAAPVPGTFEPSMSYSVRKANGSYWLIQREPGLNGGDIVAHPASTPWSFTQQAVTLYSPPEGNHAAPDYLLHYDVRVHDGLAADPDDLVLSYNVNTTAVSIGCRSKSDRVPSIYRPRFINVPKEKLLRSAAQTVVNGSSSGYSSPGVVTAGVDNQWYDAWAYATHCPPLVKPTTLSGNATSSASGDVSLTWSNYGQDMWYWLESRDATAGTAWKRPDFWTTGPAFIASPVTSSAVNGHTFEYRVVPYANGFGGREAPASNTLAVKATVARPSTPTGVTVTTPATKNGTATVKWSKVTYPTTHNFYRVFYWDRTAGVTEAAAKASGWVNEDKTSLSLTLTKGHAYGFDVQASNIAGGSTRSANVYATP